MIIIIYRYIRLYRYSPNTFNKALKPFNILKKEKDLLLQSFFKIPNNIHS